MFDSSEEVEYIRDTPRVGIPPYPRKTDEHRPTLPKGDFLPLEILTSLVFNFF